MSETTDTPRQPNNYLGLFCKVGWLAVGVWLFVLIALVYGSIQIWQMSTFLHEHSTYVRTRDAEWKPQLDGLQKYLEENHDQNERILGNQAEIMRKFR